jgi:hypothetical protein
MTVYALRNRVLARAGDHEATEDEAAQASLERQREGVSV